MLSGGYVGGVLSELHHDILRTLSVLLKFRCFANLSCVGLLHQVYHDIISQKVLLQAEELHQLVRPCDQGIAVICVPAAMSMEKLIAACTFADTQQHPANCKACSA